MNGLVHFASKNLLGTGYSESGNFVTKLFAGTLHFLCGLSLSARNDAIGFSLGAFLGIFNNRCAALFTVRDDGRRMSTCFCFDLAALGLGFGKSRQKYLYLPEEHNDYIFAIACEELGFVGAIGILILFALLIIRGYWIAMHARDRFSMLLAAGLTTLLALQVFLNVAVVTNLLPSTGISLPFFSYGGTALIMQLAENGIVLNVSRSITQSPR